MPVESDCLPPPFPTGSLELYLIIMVIFYNTSASFFIFNLIDSIALEWCAQCKREKATDRAPFSAAVAFKLVNLERKTKNSSYE